MPSTWIQEKYIRSLKFAAEAHNGQTMSGMDLPYIVHITMFFDVFGAPYPEIIETINSHSVA